MIQKVSVLTLMLAFCFLLACGEDDSGRVSPALPKVKVSHKPDFNTPIPVSDFAPPQSSAIDSAKARQYVNANAALVMMGEEWSSRIENAKGNDRIVILKKYEEAREQVCLRVGLAGLKEFEWISNVAIKDGGNADAFKKAGLKY